MEKQHQHHLVLFKHEPFLMHVQCRSLAAAQTLQQLALGSGFRESGIVLGKDIVIDIET